MGHASPESKPLRSAETTYETAREKNRNKPRRPQPVLKKISREKLEAIIISKRSSTKSHSSKNTTTNSTLTKDTHLDQSFSGGDSTQKMVDEVNSTSELQKRLGAMPISNDRKASNLYTTSSVPTGSPFQIPNQSDCNTSCYESTPSISHLHGTYPTSNRPVTSNTVGVSPQQLFFDQRSIPQPGPFGGQPSSAYVSNYSPSGRSTQYPSESSSCNPERGSIAFKSLYNSTVQFQPLISARPIPNHPPPPYPCHLNHPHPQPYPQTSHLHQRPYSARQVPMGNVPAHSIPHNGSLYHPPSSKVQLRNNTETYFNLGKLRDNRIIGNQTQNMIPTKPDHRSLANSFEQLVVLDASNSVMINTLNILGAPECKPMLLNYQQRLDIVRRNEDMERQEYAYKHKMQYHLWQKEIQEQQEETDSQYLTDLQKYTENMISQMQYSQMCENNPKLSNSKPSTSKKRKGRQASEKRKKVVKGTSVAKTNQDTLLLDVDDEYNTFTVATKHKVEENKDIQVPGRKPSGNYAIDDGHSGLYSLACKPDGLRQAQHEKLKDKLYEHKKTQCNHQKDRLIPQQQRNYNQQKRVARPPQRQDLPQSKDLRHDQQRSYQQQHQQDHQWIHQQQDPVSVQVEQLPPLHHYNRFGEFNEHLQPSVNVTKSVTQSQSTGDKQRPGTTPQGEKLSNSGVAGLHATFTTTLSSEPSVREGKWNGQSASGQCQSNSVDESSNQYLPRGRIDFTSCGNNFNRQKQNTSEILPLPTFKRNNKNAYLPPKDLVSLQCSWKESSNFTIKSEEEDDHSTFPHDNDEENDLNSDEGCEIELDLSQVETRLSRTIQNVNLSDKMMPVSVDEGLHNLEDLIIKNEPYTEDSVFQEESTVENLRVNTCFTPSPSPPNQFSALNLYQFPSHDRRLQCPSTFFWPRSFSKEHLLSSAMLSPVSMAGSCDSFTSRSPSPLTRFNEASNDQVATY